MADSGKAKRVEGVEVAVMIEIGHLFYEPKNQQKDLCG